MRACAFTGIQQRDVIVFKKKNPFSSLSTRVQRNERKKNNSSFSNQKRIPVDGT